jgi:hypothetical protein
MKMSINQSVASRHSHIARKNELMAAPGLVMSVNEYTAAEADEIVTQAQCSPKVARRFLSHINSKQRDGWRLDSFHRQLRELCVLTLANAAPRRVVSQDNVVYRVTPHAATTLH